MEFRVWVDGTQRVVCGVKPTTTCQEIVFALAHATQQAGRFTMIERWRNNERLLSPNEQPLITLNRWGDHMKEVDFILKKTSTDTQPQTNRPQVNHIASHNQPTTANSSVPQGKDLSKPNNDSDLNHHQALTNGHRESPANHNQPLNDKTSDIMFQHGRNYNLIRRPQTALGGPLTTSSSTLNLGTAYMQANANRLLHNFRPSLSASTLPNLTNGMTSSPSSSASILRPRYLEDAAVNANSPSLSMNDPHNGYQLQRDSQQVQQHPLSDQTRVGIPAKNYPYEDLYSTISKKRTNQLPPAVPAKPRLVNPAHPQHALQPNNNAQMNYYQPNSSPLNIYPRPRHPPGYLEYLEAMANRNSLPASFISNSNYIHQTSHLGQGNMFPRTLDQQQQQQQLYNIQQGGASPASSSTSNQNYYPVNGQFSRTNIGQSHDYNLSNSMQNIRHPINPKFVEPSGLVINRGSAVNVRLPSNSQAIATQNAISTEENLNNLSQSNATSVSQIGHDMLKIIEEQKKLLINQKNELDRLDNDQEYLDAKQSSEQAELINRIESEIRQLEDLWRENQAQINKLENQDFEKELEQLKTEQVRMEHEIVNQKSKLAKCENDIADCNSKIEQLEAELNDLGVDSDGSINGESVEMNPNGGGVGMSRSNKNMLESGDLKPIKSHSNGSNGTPKQELIDSKEPKTSEEDGDEDDSGGDASDDLGANLYESKLRTTKEVPYFEKRGLISGIRSLKLDKSRSTNKSIESLHSNDSSAPKTTTSTPPNSKDNKASNINNNILDGRCVDSNGHQFREKTANTNKYEFLMTL